MYFLVTSALILGLGGSLHCVGMCGPLVLGLPFHQLEDKRKWMAIFSYFLSKTLGYGVIGLLIGLLGGSLKLVIWQQVLSIFSGIFILLLFAFPYLKNKIKVNSKFNLFFNKLYVKALKNKSVFKFPALGFLNAFLPCGLVYTAMAIAISFASVGKGFAFMFIFGLGTAPLLIATIVLNYKFNLQKRKSFKMASSIFTVILGILLILRGLNLGIPHISPSFTEEGKVENCCKHK